MVYYALSDTHGFLDEMLETLSNADLENPENMLIFLGDYIDYGPDSRNMLYCIMELERSKPGQVIVLKGNHEVMFEEFLFAGDDNWLGFDKDLCTVKSFMPADEFQCFQNKVSAMFNAGEFKTQWDMNKAIADTARTLIRKNNKALLSWLRALPFFYETEKQIFVHAGIDEEAEEYWQIGTSNDVFVSKFPEGPNNSFYKDIVAGHIGTYHFAHDDNFHDIYFDGKSHYYIDGTVNRSGIIPLLKYNTETRQYTGFHKRGSEWEECPIFFTKR